jgi:glycosyltransferase involved in cell wall biosynthesis
VKGHAPHPPTGAGPSLSPLTRGEGPHQPAPSPRLRGEGRGEGLGAEVATRSRIAAIIPVLDEEGAIGPVLVAIPRDWVDEVVVVDGGSRDRTVAEASAAGAEVVVERERGYGRACARGAATAVQSGAEILVFLDGDGGDRPEVIPNLVRPIIEDKYDFVIGSRTRGAREKGSMGAHQALAGRVIGAAIGLLCGVRYSDMCAFRAIRAEALAKLGMREMTYGWNLEMQMRAARAGLRILELPVPPGRRLAGHSKVAGTVRGSLKASLRILATFARIACERRDGGQ